ncbi:MAG: bifunctional hexulose-6-phosphate synthase/ribonuclease regulator [Thermoplasmata archaeon]|nr:MAG: bifunctional hexulose-6-phosphate synthase/ribonuclease regulator [Thermoplasmata archaeon]KAA0010958.1 MAG: bifunctional hexulose-6-phosphate synthase/ribonuclease regulator [Thermoplasmata archaeon]
MAILQVALDLINAHRALQIAKEAIEGGADWLEAGTPLIKAEGMNIVRQLKKFGKKVIADMKTIDVGAVEAEMAGKAGADVICILALASNETIKEVVKAAKRYGMEVMADMMGVKNKKERAKELEKIGIDYICLHTAIDEQMVGKNPFGEMEEVISSCHLPVAIAGGINAETALQAVERGASIVIVGGAIIKAENAKEATQKIKKAMEGVKIKSRLFKKYGKEEIYEALSKVSTCNICDAMHNKGAMRGIFPLKNGYHMIGKALTVKTIDGDWAKVVEAIDIADKKDVVVVQAGEGKQAVWGELATLSAFKKGIAGIVIDGAIRDVHEIKKYDIPIFTRKIVSEAGEPKGYGEIGCEIVCGGQIVRKGDWIVGDDNGVVVIPKEEAQEIANRAINVMERENRIREEIRRGSTLSKVLNLKRWEKKK